MQDTQKGTYILWYLIITEKLDIVQAIYYFLDYGHIIIVQIDQHFSCILFFAL
jgi:hypothetical protein